MIDTAKLSQRFIAGRERADLETDPM